MIFLLRLYGDRVNEPGVVVGASGMTSNIQSIREIEAGGAGSIC
ncbi:hypothetical protein [Aminobacterium mobile]